MKKIILVLSIITISSIKTFGQVADSSLSEYKNYKSVDTEQTDKWKKSNSTGLPIKSNSNSQSTGTKVKNKAKGIAGCFAAAGATLGALIIINKLDNETDKIQ